MDHAPAKRRGETHDPAPPDPAPPPGFARLLRRHRGWLAKRGLLDRPWFILGSAPDPTLPAAFPADVVHVHVKYAGRSAKTLGLPPGDLTLLLHKTEAADLDGIALKSVIRLGKPDAFGQLKRRAPVLAVRECPLTNRERDAFFLSVLGTLFAGVGEEERPSNGVALICYALDVGAPQIIVAGLSLDVDGYGYETTARRRRHVAEDRAALGLIAARHDRVVTTEPGLHRATGLALFAG